MKYKKPIIFELGNVTELTAGGRSMLEERMSTDCLDVNDRLVRHVYTQPKGWYYGIEI